MSKFLFQCIVLLSMGNMARAQDTTAVKEQETFDTAAVLNDLMSLLDSADTPHSYAMISVGAGNRVFSVRNNRLNARQSSTSVIVFNPSLGYYHKTGLSIAAGSTLLQQKGKGFGATQFSITPAYDFSNSKSWTFGVSYSHYFISDQYSSYASPVQHDAYAYLNYKKFWLEPGIALGYSAGRYKEINQFTIRSTGNTYIDTGTYSLKSFSFMAAVSHDFEWENIITDNDALSLTPSLMMNFGADSTASVSHTLFPNLIRFLQRRNRLSRLSGKNSFSAQSAALSLDLNYNIGKFTLMPQLYLDYYLPATEEKRFTQTFTMSVGYTF